MKLFITCLHSYNCGHLVGHWVDMDIREEDLKAEIESILQEGKKFTGEYGEEYFITDYEQEHNLFDISEYSNVFDLREKFESVSDLDEDDLKKVSYLTEYVNYSLDEALEKYDEVVIYEDMSLEEVAEEYIEQTVDFSNIPDMISRNIDYKSIAYDFETSCEYDKIDSDVYHFVN